MTVIETSQRLRRTQRKVLRLQGRLWLAQLAVWPTAIFLALLLVGALWVLWQRRSTGRRHASAPAADALPHEYAP